MEAELRLLYADRLLASWALAITTAVLLRLSGRRWHIAAGIAVMTVPLWLTVLAYVNTIQVLADPNSRLASYSTRALSSIWTRSVFIDVGYLLVGAVVWASGGTWKGLWDTGPRRIAATVRGAGLTQDGGEGRSILAGLLLFPVFLVVTAMVDSFVYGRSGLVNGDESSVWAAMTPYYMLMISLAAGIGEELVYRGVLMVAAAALLRRTGMPRPAVAVIAVSLQAIVFGMAHAGYGTLAHVILPTLFGLAAGAIAYRFGLWAAIVLHTLVDVFAFGGDAALNAPWVETVLLGFLGLNFLASLAYGAWWAGQWWQHRRMPEG